MKEFNVYKEAEWLNDKNEPLFTWYKEPTELFDMAILKIIHELTIGDKLVITLKEHQR